MQPRRELYFWAAVNDMRFDYLAVAFLWILWCTVHSGLISLTVTRLLKEKLGETYRWYRLFYTLFAVISLIPIYLYSRSVESEVLFRYQGIWEVLRLLLVAAAMLLFIGPALKYDLLTFLGIRQIRSGEDPQTLSEQGSLDTTGMLGVVRHPWYTGALLLLWSYQQQFDTVSCIISAVLSIYVVVGTLLEERKLQLEFGEEYRKYTQEVSMFLPLKWVAGKASDKLKGS